MRRAVRPVLTVEATSTCNLLCEGCFYFHDDFEPLDEPEQVEVWRAFFQHRYDEGDRYAVFHGAEPALKQDRLLAAGELFSRGIVYTNGTIRMSPDIPFVRCVSIWGDEHSTTKIRGAGVYRKALRNFENDDKARFSVVVNAQNYRSLPQIAEDMHAAGVSATISYFSPSFSYMEKIRAAAPNDRRFFRFSNAKDNMLLSPEEFARIRDMMDELTAKYPDTVIQGRAFNDWLTAPGGRYELGEDGVAGMCAVRPRFGHEMYATDLKPIREKCALADNDCTECRVTQVATTSLLHGLKYYASSAEDVAFWVECALQAGRVFLRDDDTEVWGEGPPSMHDWREHFGVLTPPPR
ncbi:MAG: hypothetical protein AAFX09_00890 [Pseudomonadota bacterium]